MPKTPCDMRYTKLTNPQSYCGDDDVSLFVRRMDQIAYSRHINRPDNCAKLESIECTHNAPIKIQHALPAEHAAMTPKGSHLPSLLCTP